MTRPLVVIGDALLDRDVEGQVERVAPDAPVPVVDEHRVRSRPGGAGLAALLAASGAPAVRVVTLVTALGDDDAGAQVRALLGRAGVRVIDLGSAAPTPEKVRVRAGDHPLLRIDRGGKGRAGTVGRCTAAARAAIAGAGAVLVADYGRGVAAEPSVRRALMRLADDVPVVWDPHPLGPEPVPGAALVTPNVVEATRLVGEIDGDDIDAHAARAAALVARWQARHVCVTRGAAGALLAGPHGRPTSIPASPAPGGDPCGAGDRFASRAAELLADGAGIEEAVTGAVAAASAFVAAGGAASVDVGSVQPSDPERAADRGGRLVALGRARATSPDLPAEAADVVARTRASGGIVVATGGCFDLVHTGHVATLQAARDLGDCLVVLLNGDASVRRLKGPSRPLVAQDDRAAVLRAMRCVDAIVVFDEDDPIAALERLRPDLWVKGGDYAIEDLPETATLAAYGGRTVLLPYLDGHSTTHLIEEAHVRAL
jgi:D-beta-D-heptose 7-phosphate kinase/D-beta-D-heptose 1-phosphate adenosyltransferase